MSRPSFPIEKPLSLRIPAFVLPHYRYVPGKNPHPRTDPIGHGHGAIENFPFDESWKKDIGWLRGMDLFDNRFYWEAHEVWEFQWKARPRDCPFRVLLQGMIQAAASLLKKEPPMPRAAQRLWTSAKRRLETVKHLDRGIDIPALILAIEACHDGGGWPRISGGWP